MTNITNTTLYVGVTSNLPVRIRQHRIKHYPGSFTARYNLLKLVYYAHFPTIMEAIHREKQIKGWVRSKKEVLINAMNPDWKDLFDDIADW